jgi:glutaminyl-tRNA synthetase
VTETPSDTTPTDEGRKNFVEQAIADDDASGRYGGRLHTRFPPEPNGYLHIGHAKAICLNFGLAERREGARANLRFDDTNPSKEELEYVEAIKEDVRWLGFDWGERACFSSDYFEQLYGYARSLIEKGQAYVCDLDGEAMRERRGTLTEPGTDSPYRERGVEENLDLFTRMRAGEFADGSRTLRAKIDMASPNMNLRDPALYRIMRAHHHRTGDDWCIYPMYDWAHGQSDAIEGITHSICTLEFENHRPLYEWFLEALELPHRPRQIEFARLNLSYTLLSKRKLLRLVEDKLVEGWDDPRMPTLSGLRRRGYTKETIRAFCDRIGVAKYNGTIDQALLENILRKDLNPRAPRVMAVLRPLRVVITNYPEGQVEQLEAVNNPEDPAMGTRSLPFSRELYIERTDFLEDPPKKYFRLAPGRAVRLRYAYIIDCEEVIKDPETGEVTELRCRYDEDTKSGSGTSERKVKGVIHWVSKAHAISAEVRLYDRLFSAENPDDAPEGQDFTANLNPTSLETLTGCRLEPSLAASESGLRVQFERHGYFCVDSRDGSPDSLVFNRTVSLRDGWAKLQKKQQGGQKKQQGGGQKKKKKKKKQRPPHPDHRPPPAAGQTPDADRGAAAKPGAEEP